MSGPRVEMLAAFGPYEGGWRDGEFHNPEGLASDSDGNIWVCDETNYRIQLLSPEGRMLRKIGAVGRNGRPKGGTAPGQFWMIRGVAVDSYDNVYVGDTQNSRVQAFDANGRFRFLFGSEGNGPGQMSGLDGVAIDSDGFIYVTDTHTVLGGNNRMLKFDQRGRFLFSFGGHGTGPGRFAGKTPVVAGPEGPYGIDIGARSGLLYVADTYNDRIQVFDRDGGFVRSVGEGVIFQPRQICLDSRENIYVAGFHMPPIHARSRRRRAAGYLGHDAGEPVPVGAGQRGQAAVEGRRGGGGRSGPRNRRAGWTVRPRRRAPPRGHRQQGRRKPRLLPVRPPGTEV